METLKLEAKTRQASENPSKLRNTGVMPAVVYGNKQAPVMISVAQNEFLKTLRKAGESTLIELAIDGAVKNVLIHDLQRDALTHDPIHADFLEVSMTEKLTANVPLIFVGEPLAVKAHGGTLVKVLDAVEVECLPKDLPHEIELDITKLETFDDVITVADIKVPQGVVIISEKEEVVAKVQPPRDVEADLAQEIGDVSQVEGIAETPSTDDAQEAEAKAE